MRKESIIDQTHQEIYSDFYRILTSTKIHSIKRDYCQTSKSKLNVKKGSTCASFTLRSACMLVWSGDDIKSRLREEKIYLAYKILLNHEVRKTLAASSGLAGMKHALKAQKIDFPHSTPFSRIHALEGHLKGLCLPAENIFGNLGTLHRTRDFSRSKKSHFTKSQNP